MPTTARHGARPDAIPTPPADLGRSNLPLLTIGAKQSLYRIHRAIEDALWFGPRPAGKQGRFDDPKDEFGTCYLGLSPAAAFAEAFLRRPPVRLLSRAFLDERNLTTIELTRGIRVVQLHGAGLAQLGATAAVASGPHNTAQAWSRAFWEHPSAPDGLQYRCRHNDDEFSVALYDRARDKLQVIVSNAVRADTQWFGNMLDHYHLGLDD